MTQEDYDFCVDAARRAEQRVLADVSHVLAHELSELRISLTQPEPNVRGALMRIDRIERFIRRTRESKGMTP